MAEIIKLTEIRTYAKGQEESVRYQLTRHIPELLRDTAEQLIFF